MSREIPLDRALTDEDRLYLRQRGTPGVAMETRIDEMFPPDPAELAAYNAKEKAMYASQHSAGSELADVLARNAALEQEIAALRAAQAAGGSSDSGAGKQYDEAGWTKVGLEGEIDRVNAEDPEAKLANGTKAEMIAALNAYFAE